MRRINYGSFEHQQREIHAQHVRQHGEGPITDWGNGKTVMRVVKARNRPTVEIIGEDGLNEFGEEFLYADYFFAEDRVTA